MLVDVFSQQKLQPEAVSVRVSIYNTRTGRIERLPFMVNPRTHEMFQRFGPLFFQEFFADLATSSHGCMLGDNMDAAEVMPARSIYANLVGKRDFADVMQEMQDLTEVDFDDHGTAAAEQFHERGGFETF